MSMYYSPNNINNERCMEPQLEMLLRYVFAISDASQALSVAPLREGRAWWGYRYGFGVLVPSAADKEVQMWVCPIRAYHLSSNCGNRRRCPSDPAMPVLTGKEIE